MLLILNKCRLQISYLLEYIKMHAKLIRPYGKQAGRVGFEPTRCVFTNHHRRNRTARLPIPPPPKGAGFLSRTRITGNLCLRDDRQPRPAYKASRIALLVQQHSHGQQSHFSIIRSSITKQVCQASNVKVPLSVSTDTVQPDTNGLTSTKLANGTSTWAVKVQKPRL